MSRAPAYTEYHPRWHRTRVSTYWWMHRWSYLAFILRELSSIFIAWFVVYLLLLVRAVTQGDSHYQQFLGWFSPPGHEHLLAVLRHPLTRMVLFLLCMLSLFHWAHRFRYTLYDGLQIKHINEVINVLCYGGAIVGSVLAAYLLWTVPT